jgi:hypothetical protein
MITAGAIQSTNYNGSSAGMQIDLDNAEFKIYEADGLVVKSGGGIKLESGGDLTIEDGGDLILKHGTSSHSRIKFDSTVNVDYSGEIYYEDKALYIMPQAVDYNSLVVGSTDAEWVAVDVKASSSITLGIRELSVLRGYIAEDLRFKPVVDDYADLGASSYRYDDIYATNSTIQTSDETLKEDIRDVEIGVDFLKRIRPISFRWKNIESQHGSSNRRVRRHYGFSAQQIESVLTTQNISLNDFAGITKDSETGRYGLRPGELIPILVKAIQELQERIENL